MHKKNFIEKIKTKFCGKIVDVFKVNSTQPFKHSVKRKFIKKKKKTSSVKVKFKNTSKITNFKSHINLSNYFDSYKFTICKFTV